MYRFTARPQTGHNVIAEHSFHSSYGSKSHQTGDRESSSNPELKPAKHNFFNLALIGSIVVSLSLLGTAGCGVDVRGASTSAASSSTLVATPASIDFGSVSDGDSADQKLTLANTGSDPVQITALDMSNSAFSLDGKRTLPLSLAAGSSLSLSVHFSPTDTTDASGQLSVSATGPTSAALSSKVELHGRGIKKGALANLSCANSSMSGAGSDTCTVTLSSPAQGNTVEVNLESSSKAIKVPGSVTVSSGSTTATFVASVSEVTTPETVTLTAKHGSETKSTAINLGDGAASSGTASLSVSTTSLAFGNVAVGTAVTKSVTVTSNGALAVNISSDSITGTGFSITGGNGPVTLHSGESAVLTVQYAPTSAASATGQLTIASNASTATVSLSGTGTTAAPALSALVCGSTSITGQMADSCTVSLSGSAPSGGISVALASSSASVQVPAAVMVPATAKSATFTANVTSVTTAQAVTLTASAGSNSQSVSLKLGTATGALAVNATTIAFGSTALNTPTSQSLKLTASGSASVTIKSVAITGAGFTLTSGTFPITLTSGQSANLELQFDPTTAGAATGQLTINSDSPSNPTTVISLTGTGAAAHKVALSWDAPTGNDAIAGYNVYREGGGATAYSRLNSSLDSSTTYTDTSVQSGQTYEYIVKAVDASGQESSASNMTTVTIP